MSGRDGFTYELGIGLGAARAYGRTQYGGVLLDLYLGGWAAPIISVGGRVTTLMGTLHPYGLTGAGLVGPAIQLALDRVLISGAGGLGLMFVIGGGEAGSALDLRLGVVLDENASRVVAISAVGTRVVLSNDTLTDISFLLSYQGL